MKKTILGLAALIAACCPPLISAHHFYDTNVPSFGSNITLNFSDLTINSSNTKQLISADYNTSSKKGLNVVYHVCSSWTHPYVTADGEVVAPVETSATAQKPAQNGNDFSITATKDGAARIRVVYQTNSRPNQVGTVNANVTLKVTRTAQNAPNIVPTLYLRPSEYIQKASDPCDGTYLKTAAAKGYHYAGITFPELTQYGTTVTLSSNGTCCQPYATGRQKTKYIELILDNVKAGDVITLSSIAMTIDNDYARQITWGFPYLTKDGYLFLQAEDFDEAWINGNDHPGITPMFTTNDKNTYRRYTEDRNVILHTDGVYSLQYQTDHQTDKANAPAYWIYQFQRDANNWARYDGEYPVSGTNHISLPQAFDNFSAYAEYTIDVEEDMEFDLSYRAGAQFTGYKALKGFTYDIRQDTQQNGVWNVPGTPDFYNTYGSCYALYLDGKLLKHNWTKYPKYTPGMSGKNFQKVILDPSLWSPIESDVLVNIIPHPQYLYGADKDHERWEAFTLGYHPTGRPDGTIYEWFKNKDDGYHNWIKDFTISDEDLEYLNRTDYANIPVTKGRHTLKVVAYGGAQTVFDAMYIRGHERTGLNPHPDGKLPVTKIPLATVSLVIDDDNKIDILSNDNVEIYPGQTLNFFAPDGFSVRYRACDPEDIQGNRAPSQRVVGSWNTPGTNDISFVVPQYDTDKALEVQVVNPTDKKTGEIYSFIIPKGGGKVTDIDTPEVAEPIAPVVEFFNLQGVKVAPHNLAPGIYIRREGNKTTKVIIR